MNIQSIIMTLMYQLGDVQLQDGIVYVTTPSGVKWSFTLPQIDRYN